MQDQLGILLKHNLMRVPKKAKRMPIQEFVMEYGALPDVASTARKPQNDENEEDAGLPQTAVKGAKIDRGAMMAPPPARTAVAATPVHSRSQPSVLSTPLAGSSAVMATPKFNPRDVTAQTPGLRTARKGEAVMSINGSPILL